MTPEHIMAIVALLGALGGGVAWWFRRPREKLQVDQEQAALTEDLLRMARGEIAAARDEVKELRPLVSRLAHLEEALDHIHALLHADGAAEWEAARRRATAFLTRMRRLAEAKGAIINEVQRAQSLRAIEGGSANG